MNEPILSGEGAGLKRPRKRIAIAVALVVGAAIFGWVQLREAGDPVPLELRSGESLSAREVQLREIIGNPPGAPEGFECARAYEVRTIAPEATFSKEFRLNFSGIAQRGLRAIRIHQEKWEPVECTRPWLGRVDYYIEDTRPGIYALGHMR
jgi:hypothetical protein